MVSQSKQVYSKWLILVAAFLTMFLCGGFPFNMSVLNVELLKTFGKSQAETALVQSVNVGMLLSAGVLSGHGVNRFGVRKMGICGALMSFLGISLSFFATSIPYLVVSVGIVAGLGLSLCFVSSTTIIAKCFEGRARILAVSFIYFGSGSGGMVYPFLLDNLIRTYGWRGCLLITGALIANSVCLFAVCKPIPVEIPEDKYVTKTPPVSQQQSPIWTAQATKSTYNTDIHQREDKRTALNNNSEKQNRSKGKTFTTRLKSLATNYIFVMVTIATGLTLSASNSLMIFLVDFFTTKGFDDQTALLLYFYMSLSNTFGRLAPGIIKNIPHVGVLIMPAFFSGVGAVVNIAILRATSYTHHVILLLGFGTALGSNVASMSLTTLELVGVESYSLGFGVLITTVGISNVSAGPVSGWLRDITGSYSASFYSSAGAHLVALCLYSLATIIRKCKNQQQELRFEDTKL